MDNYYFHMDNLSVGYNRKALIHDMVEKYFCNG